MSDDFIDRTTWLCSLRRALLGTTVWLWGLSLMLTWPAKSVLAQSCDWAPLGSGTNNPVAALTCFDDGTGPALYVGGAFTTAGGVTANRIAKWDGSKWASLDSGMNGVVRALTCFDDGTGLALYAGGHFTMAGGVAANRIAKWDGNQWAPLDSGMNGIVTSLTVVDDGTGSTLYAGGEFTTAGSVTANRIAKWDGHRWAPLGSGMSGGAISTGVDALTCFDDGTGAALYAGGEFTIAGDAAANHIAKWDGKQWSPVGQGMDGNLWHCWRTWSMTAPGPVRGCMPGATSPQPTACW